jgi:lysophospholipase L1-like esterase
VLGTLDLDRGQTVNTSQFGRGKVSSRTLWAALVGLLLVGVAVVFAAAEVGIRLLQSRKYGTAATVEKHYTVDKRIDLRVPIANLRLGRIETNSLGFRGPEIAVPKPAGTVRVAFLGASTTWCAEVSGNEYVWAHLVAQDLRRMFPGRSVDYVNGGVPGYVVESSLRNLEHRIAPLRPDIVVIYHATNDMSVELRRLAAASGVIREAKVAPPSWLSNYSLLWNLAEKNFRIWMAQRKAERAADRLDVEAASLGAAFRRDLAALIRRAQQEAKVVAVATFSARLRDGQSNEEQLRAAASALYYMPFMTPRGLLDSYARYNQVIREVARETGALLVEEENDIPGDEQHFTDSVHFTDAGSRAMATRVSAVLARSAEVKATFDR